MTEPMSDEQLEKHGEACRSENDWHGYALYEELKRTRAQLEKLKKDAEFGRAAREFLRKQELQ